MTIYDLKECIEAKKLQDRLICQLCRKPHAAEKFYVICPDCVREHHDCGKAFKTLLEANALLSAELLQKTSG